MVRRMGLALAVAVTLLGGALALSAQGVAADSLEAARKLYASAAYEDALAMLDRLKARDAQMGIGERRDMEATRALCLLALGRDREARQAMEAVVFTDPQFEFEEREAAPRVRAMLEETRARRLPQIVKDRYAAAREAYDRGEYADAAARFDAVLVLLEDPVLRESDEAASMQELKVLARDFHAISTKAVADAAAYASAAREAAASRPAEQGQHANVPATTPAGPQEPGSNASRQPSGASSAGPPPVAVGTSGPASSPGAPEPASSAPGPATYSAPGASAAIVPPVAVEQPVPSWSEDLGLEPGRTYRATVEVVIDQTGRVTSSRILDSINPVYDARLTESLRAWRYRPGTRSGVPVRFTKLVTVTVEARE